MWQISFQAVILMD